MNNALATIQASEWDTMLAMSRVLVQSKFLPSAISTPEQAVTIMMAGRAIGVDAWTALQNINVIQGKPTVNPQLMLALIRNSGQLEDIRIQGDDGQCGVTMKRRGETPHTETFTMQDAAKMQLANKDNWKKQPAVMLKWRAVSACARVVFPDVILGLYTPEEMGGDIDPETGEIAQNAPQAPQTHVTVEHTPTAAKTPPLASNGQQRPSTKNSSEPEYAQVDENGEIVLPPQTGTKRSSIADDSNTRGKGFVGNSTPPDMAVVMRDTASLFENEFAQNAVIERGRRDGWFTNQLTTAQAIAAIRANREAKAEHWTSDTTALESFVLWALEIVGTKKDVGVALKQSVDDYEIKKMTDYRGTVTEAKAAVVGFACDYIPQKIEDFMVEQTYELPADRDHIRDMALALATDKPLLAVAPQPVSANGGR